MSRTQISIRIDDELYARLKKVAEVEERSISGTIRRALRVYCKQAES